MMAPMPGPKPAPLAYYVAAPESTTRLFSGGATDCTGWARREAVTRGAPLDVREASTGVVIFGFDATGVFC